jgi:hypothetical protein
MGVAAGHFFDIAGNDIPDGEFAFFLSQLGVEYDLEQKIAQFFLDFCGVALLKGVNDFIGFFDQERLQRFRGLLAVPGTPLGAAKPLHEIGQIFQIILHNGPSLSGSAGCATPAEIFSLLLDQYNHTGVPEQAFFLKALHRYGTVTSNLS